jgi:glycosyltransferase involved in cell wall biosynthesis
MSHIVFIATAWGAEQGGINSFNTDLTRALGVLLHQRVSVTCVVLNAKNDDIEDARRSGVNLLVVGGKEGSWVEPTRAADVAAAVKQLGNGEPQWWIGHDLISGETAIAMPHVTGKGRSAVINHMSYIDYFSYKHGVGALALEKHERQQKAFGAAEKLFAVGPLLRDRLADMVLKNRSEIHMLIPGLAEIEPAPVPASFNGITFGRLDPENDRIKQGRLAIAGFALACDKANTSKGTPRILRQGPRLYVVGISEAGGLEEESLRELAREKANRTISLIPLPFQDDRRRLFNVLRSASVAMMLSWHEGFGLTGWEAIAAEVPLIASRNSGLYRLLEELLAGAGLGCIKSLVVRGEEGLENFRREDEEAVCDAILEIAEDMDGAKRSAKMLRTLLLREGCTWLESARRFAVDLGLFNTTASGASRVNGETWRVA